MEMMLLYCRTGSIQPGDQLLAIDNVRLDNCTLEDSARVLQDTHDIVKLTIKKDENFAGKLFFPAYFAANLSPDVVSDLSGEKYFLNMYFLLHGLIGLHEHFNSLKWLIVGCSKGNRLTTVYRYK